MYKTYILKNNGWVAEIVPEAGADIVKLTHNGENVLIPKKSDNPLEHGAAILSLAEVTEKRENIINSKGESIPFPKCDENLYYNGELYKQKFEVASYNEKEIMLIFKGNSEIYPYNISLEVKYTMVENGIKLTYIFKNYSLRYIPIVFGLNTRFALPENIAVPLKERQLSDENGIPNGTYGQLNETEKAIVSGIPTDEFNGNGYYSSNGDTATIGQYSFMVSGNFNHWVLKKDKNSIYVKPVSGAVNGLNFENATEELWPCRAEMFVAFIRMENNCLKSNDTKNTKEEWLSQYKNSVSERDYHLLSCAYDILKHNTIQKETYPWGDIPVITPWVMENSGIWGWDSAFHAITVSRFDTYLAKCCIKAYLLFQMENGMFSDAVLSRGKYILTFTKPPVLAWAVTEVYKKERDIDFLKWCYERLVKNEEWWYNEHRNGEFFFYSFGAESGWDNSPRWDKDCPGLWAIDLQCFMVTTYRALAFMAKELGDIEKAVLWEEREKWLIKAIETRFFDEEQQTYADLSVKTGEFSNVLSPASFMPLFIGIASKEHATAMEKIGRDKFYPGMPTVAYDDPEYAPPGYWRGTTWLNVAYMAAKGLKDYGFNDLADGIKEYLLSMIYDNSKEGIFENYDSLKRKGLHFGHFSWSAAFTIEFILNW